MPKRKNAKKAVKVMSKREKSNNEYAASMKNAIKKVERAVATKDKNAAGEALKVAIKKIDKATSKGAVAKNNSARNKSRITKKVNEME